MEKIYSNPQSDKYYESLCRDLSLLPFSFNYGGKKYKGLSPEFFTLKEKNVESFGDKENSNFVFCFTDGIEVSLKLTHYYLYGVTELTVFFENNSDKNSRVLKDIETELKFIGKYPVLKGILGDHVNKYRPYSIDLQENCVEFSSDTGRATHINFPYFNLEYGNGGVMLAIGWAGTWKARFSSNKKTTTFKASAVNGLKTYLKPHEKIRSALFVIAPYTIRNETYATNFWRSWFINCNMPKSNIKGESITPFSTCCLASDTGLPNSDGSISENHNTWKPSVEKMIKEDVKVDFRWFDAGWYVSPDKSSPEPFNKGHDWWDTIGTWELDPRKWPEKTFANSVDFCHKNGIKTLVWFEPERVTDPENLAKNYGYNSSWAIKIDGEKAISNNIGNPDCLKWTTDRICKMLKENKIDLYREDNNCNAAKLWKYLDKKEGKNRNGITELKFIDAHYKMWDEIIKCTMSYGGCGFVDSCASGGGRNDLESMRRSVPLLRSDSDRTSCALRLSMSSSFLKWIPFCGANTKEKQTELALTGISDKYVWRASYLPSLNVDSQFVYDETQNFDVLRFGLREWESIKPYLLKEFYTLTPWHSEKDNTSFTAFAFYDSEKNKGVILAFRQEKCAEKELKISLPFGSNKDKFLLTDKDTDKKKTAKGYLKLNFNAPRTSKLIWVEKI